MGQRQLNLGLFSEHEDCDTVQQQEKELRALEAELSFSSVLCSLPSTDPQCGWWGTGLNLLSDACHGIGGGVGRVRSHTLLLGLQLLMT